MASTAIKNNARCGSKMGIRMTTPMASVNKFFRLAMSILKEEIVLAFAKLGEESVGKIRDRSGEESWFDQTGNLRSSIGYSVYDYGKKMIESAFEVVKEGIEGSAAGRMMVEELSSEYSKVFALVVVAAMNYADFVEAKENKDVLASIELWARSVVDTRLKQAVGRAVKRINQLRL